ncbi:S41 family peptidase [Aggregatimonas sangjinii]|uniref:S41 family peptidase n=1 Tax=Aggregatimonas sangjinii TaxID=2583587 RepID=A0A5B7SYJ6_9FLAO|nr:S41 family peptidase [Aggregatimonas sangjinii]QCX02183.1 S41 family peptidase [Aggregatimonas sangjinii]
MKKSLLGNFTLFILIGSLFSCQSDKKNDCNTVDGVWKSLGYGRIVKIEAGEYLLADVTSISCVPMMEGSIAEFGDKLKVKNDTLSLENGINTYYFIRVADAPAICKKETLEYKAAQAKANDPEYNFEVLWNTFKDHYAYFELRKVDPEKMYAEYRPKINQETTDAELFLVLNEMLESFDDGHIGIDAPDEIEEAAMKLYDEEQSADDQEEAVKEAPKERLRNHEVSAEVAKKYIPKGTYVKNGNLRWGILKDNIGYLQINQMMGLADYGISDTLSYRDYWMAYFEKLETVENDNKDELEGINQSLDSIMKDLGNTDALIIDVRFNGGGKDEVGMAVLTRLNDKERMVFTKKGKMGDGFTPINSVTQPGTENAYTKPIYLLIGPEAASATEIMALSAMSLPNITTIGSRTEGVFSDILDRSLPNGWEFGLSSEVYQDLQGKNYEGMGIPPDIEIGYERDTQKFLHRVINGLAADGDEAIEKAIEIMKED